MRNFSRRKGRVKTPVGSFTERTLITWAILIALLLVTLARSWAIYGGIHIHF